VCRVDDGDDDGGDDGDYDCDNCDYSYCSSYLNNSFSLSRSLVKWTFVVGRKGEGDLLDDCLKNESR
jgi:hypothetical protein